MSLDLSNPLDFARATLGDVGAIASRFKAFNPDPSQWQIVEASYQANGEQKPVLFHVFKLDREDNVNYQAGLDQIQDSGGRRKAKYLYPYQDGQGLDDLGRKPTSYSFNVVLFGAYYLDALKEVMRQFNLPVSGILRHPVMGELSVAVEDVQIIHKSDSRKSVALSVTFIEHNIKIGSDKKSDNKETTQSAISKALDAFVKIENMINKVDAEVKALRTLKNQVIQALESYKQNYAKTLTRMNVTFLGTVEFISLLPTQLGGHRNSDGTTTADEFAVALSPNDPFASTPVEELSTETVLAVAINELNKEVNQRRLEVNNILSLIKDGDMELELHDQILDLKQTSVNMQLVLETGASSSNAQIIEYVLPRKMSIREVAFVNGLVPDRFGEILLLNSQLESVNDINKGTVLKVPAK